MPSQLVLTPNSWLLHNKIGCIGLLVKKEDKFVLFTHQDKIEYNSLKDIEKEYGKLVEEIRHNEDDIVTHVGGFPVKHKEVHIVSENPAQYNTGGNMIFSAGFWVIEFPNSIATVLCPKTATIAENTCHGPYRTKLEANNHKTNVETNKRLSK